MTGSRAIPEELLPAEVLERRVLTAAVAVFPERLTIDELVLQTVEDPADPAELDASRNAIRDLRRAGLLRYQNDAQIVEPTHAAMAAHRLLTS